jgi:hypothetical protein
MVLWADLAAAVGDQPFVHEGLEALRPYRHQFAVAGTAVGATGPVAYALAMLERASGNVTAARAAAAEGRALAEAMGAKPWIERGDRLLESLA